MSQVELDPFLRYPTLPPNKTGEFELISAEMLIGTEDGRHEQVTFFPGRRRFQSGLYIKRPGQKRPRFTTRDDLDVQGLAIDRGDGSPVFMPADRVRCVERRLDTGVIKLLVEVHLIEPEPVPPLGPPKQPR